jgi:hypothetical protein
MIFDDDEHDGYTDYLYDLGAVAAVALAMAAVLGFVGWML